MKKDEIEKKLNHAVEQITPDVKEHIVNACGEQDGQRSAGEPAATPGRRHSWRRYGTMAAALALCLIGAYALGRGSALRTPIQPIQPTEPIQQIQPAETETQQNVQTVESATEEPITADIGVAAVVFLDVNPSFSLDVSAAERVIAVKTLNQEAETVLGTMNLTDVPLDVAVNALVGALIQNGYLNELQNSILVSVENDDSVKGAELQEKIEATIQTVQKDAQTELAVLSQVVGSSDKALAADAENHHISLGKAKLIQQAVAQDPTLNFADLAGMSINEISLILQSRNISPETVSQTGTSSAVEYISREDALNIACQAAGVQNNQVTRTEVEFDSEGGIMVYEIEFHANQMEYEFDIDARTGSIIGQKTEALHESHGRPDYNTPANNTPANSGNQGNAVVPDNSIAGNPDTAFIGEEAAKTIAFTHAGVNAGDVTGLKVELDREDYGYVYEISFDLGFMEYDYDINAYDGTIVDYDIEIDD